MNKISYRLFLEEIIEINKKFDKMISKDENTVHSLEMATLLSNITQNPNITIQGYLATSSLGSVEGFYGFFQTKNRFGTVLNYKIKLSSRIAKEMIERFVKEIIRKYVSNGNSFQIKQNPYLPFLRNVEIEGKDQLDIFYDKRRVILIPGKLQNN